MLRHRFLLPFLLLAVFPTLAQEGRRPPAPRPAAQVSQRIGSQQAPTQEEIEREKELKKAQSKQRYQEIRRDTDRLLTLATQLKREVDTAGQETLSLAVIKKAEEIEKLAKSVRSKMKGD